MVSFDGLVYILDQIYSSCGDISNWSRIGVGFGNSTLTYMNCNVFFLIWLNGTNLIAAFNSKNVCFTCAKISWKIFKVRLISYVLPLMYVNLKYFGKIFPFPTYCYNL
jgi:hypothetical protein